MKSLGVAISGFSAILKVRSKRNLHKNFITWEKLEKYCIYNKTHYYINNMFAH